MPNGRVRRLATGRGGPPSANGTEDGTHATQPRMPKILTWVDMPADYGAIGMKIRIWRNYPRRIITAMQTGVDDERRTAIRQLIIEHNGWLDDEGEPIPPAGTDPFWDAIPDELGAAILGVITAEAGKLRASIG